MASNKKKRTIEDFLSPKGVKEYVFTHKRVGRGFLEIFASTNTLYRHYTDEFPQIESFRSELAGALTDDNTAVKAIADRWVFFLKYRMSVMEPWSMLASGIMAVSAWGAALFSLLDKATGTPTSREMLGAFAVTTIVAILFKHRVDERVSWVKFISGQLEAIAKVWPIGAIEGEHTTTATEKIADLEKQLHAARTQIKP